MSAGNECNRKMRDNVINTACSAHRVDCTRFAVVSEPPDTAAVEEAHVEWSLVPAQPADCSEFIDSTTSDKTATRPINTDNEQQRDAKVAAAIHAGQRVIWVKSDDLQANKWVMVDPHKNCAACSCHQGSARVKVDS